MLLLMNTKPVSSLFESKGQRCSPPTRKKKQQKNAITNPWPDGQKGVSDPAQCNVCLSLHTATSGDIRSAVTHWRPRFLIAAGEASCPGGEVQKPAPSGRYLVCEGSPASSAYGETSSDPEETIETKILKNKQFYSFTVSDNGLSHSLLCHCCSNHSNLSPDPMFLLWGL